MTHLEGGQRLWAKYFNMNPYDNYFQLLCCYFFVDTLTPNLYYLIC